jgi:hypothetical protein
VLLASSEALVRLQDETEVRRLRPGHWLYIEKAPLMAGSAIGGVEEVPVVAPGAADGDCHRKHSQLSIGRCGFAHSPG